MLLEIPDFIKNRHKPKHLLPQTSDYKTLLALFFMFCAGPIWFYFVFIYCGNMLRDYFEYTTLELLQNNLIVSLAFVIINIVYAQLSYRIYPLNINKFLLKGLVVFVALLPYLLDHLMDSSHILMIQIVTGIFGVGAFPATDIFYRNFPVLRRMTLFSMGFAFARAFMFVVTSFGLIYLDLWMGRWGLWGIMIPSMLTYTWALKHFEKIDLPYKNTLTTPIPKKQPIILSKAA
jgi:MFS transporter, MHS family, proline/betaine transporter